MQRGYLVDWDQLFLRRNQKCWNFSKKATRWRSFGGGNDAESGPVLLGDPILQVRGDSRKIASNCWVLTRAKNTANVGIGVHLNAHSSPRRSMELGCNLVFIDIHILKPCFHNHSATLPLREWIEWTFPASKGFANSSQTKRRKCAPHLPPSLRKSSPSVAQIAA